MKKVFLIIFATLTIVFIQRQVATVQEKESLAFQTSNNIVSLVQYTNRLLDSNLSSSDYLRNRDAYMRELGRFSVIMSEADAKLELSKMYPNAMYILNNLQTISSYLPLGFDEFTKDNKWVVRISIMNQILQDKTEQSLEELLSYFNQDPSIVDLVRQIKQEFKNS